MDFLILYGMSKKSSATGPMGMTGMTGMNPMGMTGMNPMGMSSMSDPNNPNSWVGPTSPDGIPLNQPLPPPLDVPREPPRGCTNDYMSGEGGGTGTGMVPWEMISEGYTYSTSDSVIPSIIGCLIGCYAVYLSWTCNTAQGIGTVEKIIRAFFAFIFGLLYLLVYVIFYRGECKMAKESQGCEGSEGDDKPFQAKLGFV